MLCLDTKVKPSSITPSQYQAMEFTWSQFELNKKKNILDKDFIQLFNQVEENGLTYYTQNQQETMTMNDEVIENIAIRYFSWSDEPLWVGEILVSEPSNVLAK